MNHVSSSYFGRPPSPTPFATAKIRAAKIVETSSRQYTTVDAMLKDERAATVYYSKLRADSSNVDVKMISNNIGIPKYRIHRVKEHLFIKDGRGSRFDPDIEVVDAWDTLRETVVVLSSLWYKTRRKCALISNRC